MTAIIIPRRHHTQPQGRVALASEWQGAETAWLGSNPTLNLGSGPNYVPQSGAAVLSPVENGVGMRGTAYEQKGWVNSRTANPATENWAGVTLVLEVFFTNIGGAAPGLLSFVPVGEFYGGWNLTAESSGGKRFFFSRFGNNASGLSLTSSMWGVEPAQSEWNVGDRWRLVFAYSPSSASVRLHGRKWNEPKILNARGSASGGWRNMAALNNIGGYERSGFRASTYPITCAAIFPYALEDAGADALLDNPFQLFRADPIRIYSFPSGPIIPSLSGLTTSNITSSGARHSLTLTY